MVDLIHWTSLATVLTLEVNTHPLTELPVFSEFYQRCQQICYKIIHLPCPVCLIVFLLKTNGEIISNEFVVPAISYSGRTAILPKQMTLYTFCNRTDL